LVLRGPDEDDLMDMLDLSVDVDLNRKLRLEVSMPTEDSYGQQLAQLSTVYMNVSLGGEMAVAMQEGDTSLIGGLDINGGKARIFGTSLEVEQKEQAIQFSGKDYDNPRINGLRTVYSSGDYGDVVVAIDGYVDDMTLDFTSENSDQVYGSADLVSILLFGMPLSQMGDSQGELNSLVLNMAMATFNDQVSAVLGGATLIDEVEFDISTGVRVGKSLSDNLFLSYRRNSKAEDDQNINEVSLEWLLSRRMYAEFVYGDREGGSGDLYWRVPL